jgi:hypothetical protein
MSSINIYWFVLPLTIAISLVYSATRNELWSPIFTQAARLCLMILAILVGTTAVLLLINSQIL